MDSSMKRKILFVVLAALLLCIACAAGAETVKVEGEERVSLRSSPNGKVFAKIYSGVPAELLETKGKWSRIRIGEDPVSVTGWMMSEYLSPVEAGEWLYPGRDCIPSQGHDPVPLLNGNTKNAVIADVWDGTDQDAFLTVAGIFSDNAWLLVVRTGSDNELQWFYAAADSLSGYESAYVISRAADTVVNLRAEPNARAKVLESCFGGVLANYLFDFEEAEGWSRICIGGVAGFMMNEFLEEAEFDVPPYRPPLCALAAQTVPVYAEGTGNAPLIGGEILTENDVFLILSRGKTRYHIRIDTEEPGVYRYGWIDHAALKTQDLVAGSTKAVISRDTPVVDWDHEERGTLKAGQAVTLRWFYSSFSSEDTTPVFDYCDPNTSKWVWIDADMEGEGFEEWGVGFVPVDAVDLDPYLVFPDPMGKK